MVDSYAVVMHTPVLDTNVCWSRDRIAARRHRRIPQIVGQTFRSGGATPSRRHTARDLLLV